MLVDSEGKTCQSTTSLLFMKRPLSWIFTKYANEWPPRKKIRKVSTRKKIRKWSTRKKNRKWSTRKKNRKWSTRKKNRKWPPRKKNRKWSTRKKIRKWSPRKKNRKWSVSFDLWPMTFDLTYKKDPLTTGLYSWKSRTIIDVKFKGARCLSRVSYLINSVHNFLILFRPTLTKITHDNWCPKHLSKGSSLLGIFILQFP